MNRCRRCGSEFEAIAEQPSGESTPGAIVCPHCGSTNSHTETDQTDADRSLEPIARFSNLAKLGFFEELLHDSGIEMAVREIDEFNAVHGQWDRCYILSVASEEARRAAGLMQRQLGSDTIDGESAETSSAIVARSGSHAVSLFNQDHDDGDLALDPAKLWVPLVLVALAGGLAIWALTAGRSNEVPAGGMLWDALGESDEALQTLPAPKGVARRLQYDPQTGHFILEEDTNGDHRFDRRREFSRERLLIDRKQ